MGARATIAKATSAALTWGLKNVAHRTAGSLPGKVALKIDPSIVRELRGKLKCGSVVVVGTNGKTTVTNVIADVFERAGHSVLCNRTGANLKNGIATALLQGKPSDWGVIECDELWLAKVTPDLRPTYIVLLDLFRDQLDRCGELDRIQEAIVEALAASPETTLVFNADDPLCAYVAESCSNPKVAFGIAESMELDQNSVADATMCQRCSHMFEYEYRQYGQLGAFACPSCGFSRPKLDFAARNVRLGADGLTLEVEATNPSALLGLSGAESSVAIKTHMAASYMAYNISAVAAATLSAGCLPGSVSEAVAAFNPKNGRLQRFTVAGHDILLNLAKNPTGFNQNLRIVEADERPKAAAFFVNDQVADGCDISWIWDIDFEELASQGDVRVFVGGSRRNDLQVRFKYAGIAAELANDIDDVLAGLSRLEAAGQLPNGSPLYAICNYSAMPPVHKRLGELASAGMAEAAHARQEDAVNALEEGVAASTSMANAAAVQAASATANAPLQNAPATPNAPASVGGTPIVIAHILPDLLNLYGDGGNVRILEQRLRWRGVPVEVCRINNGDPIQLDGVDLVLLGGGPDREQRLAAKQIVGAHNEFASYIDAGGPVLAVCGGYQILGRTWLSGDEEVAGLSVLNMETHRPSAQPDRLIGNVAIQSPIASAPVIGFENHAGRTHLDEGVSSFGRVMSKVGSGNNDSDQPSADGVLQGRILGTYLHGVLLSKNPEVADWLLGNALARHAERTGEPALSLSQLPQLDDSVELAANAFMAEKLI